VGGQRAADRRADHQAPEDADRIQAADAINNGPAAIAISSHR
jgi:hypothetical protein